MGLTGRAKSDEYSISILKTSYKQRPRALSDRTASSSGREEQAAGIT